jgi:hypothetical protein
MRGTKRLPERLLAPRVDRASSKSGVSSDALGVSDYWGDRRDRLMPTREPRLRALGDGAAPRLAGASGVKVVVTK